MEDTFLNVLFVLVSLILSKDKVFHDQDDEILVSMQDHEHVLLEEGAKLQQSIAMELPYLNQEVPQGHHGVPGAEGGTSDVQQITPNVKTTAKHKQQLPPEGGQNQFRQKDFAPDDQEILGIDKNKWTLHMAKEGVSHDNSESSVDQNVSQREAAQPEMPTHGDHQADQGLLQDQSVPKSNQASQKPEDTFTWYLWKLLSLISLFRILKNILRKSKPQRKAASQSTSIPSVASAIDNKTLTGFHNQCVLVPPSRSWQTCEFVEGFVSDLLETVRNMSSEMEIEDFVGVGSFYEQWASKKSIVCDIHVPIIPPKAYGLEFEILKENRGSSTIQYCCRVKMVKSSISADVCPCSSSNSDDDMLCLLHQDNKKDQVTENCISEHLCQENSSYLAKTNIVKCFKTAITKAWKKISHKYEFELIFPNSENPGSLKVRFRSGRTIRFNLTPIVRFKDSEIHLASFLHSVILPDTHWPLCFAHYENTLLQHVTKTLPDNACHIYCLQVLSFLHKHQTGLTGPCGLTSYHFKNATLHLLLNKPSHSWEPEHMLFRLNDLLAFLQQKLTTKTFNHALIGNPLVPCEIRLPEEFRVGKPVNLLLPILLNEKLYLKTNKCLKEMIRNMPVLIYEYGSVRNVL